MLTHPDGSFVTNPCAFAMVAAAITSSIDKPGNGGKVCQLHLNNKMPVGG